MTAGKLLLALLCSAVPASAGETIVFQHVNVIDVIAKRPTSAVIRDQTVVINGTKIAAVAARAKIPTGARVIDATGKYLIPGLYDAHVHCMFADRIPFCFPMLVANGVTSIRDMGGALSGAEIARVRADLASGKLVGPRLAAVAGKIVDGPFTPRDAFVNVNTPQEARDTVANARAAGWDFIKAYNLLDRDVYRALIDEAKKQKMRVDGHVPFSMTASEVSSLGQSTIEHVADIPFSTSRDEATLRERILKEGASAANANWARARVEIDAVRTYDETKAKTLFATFVRNGTWQCPTLVLKRMSGAATLDTLTSDARLQYIPQQLQERWRTTFTQLVIPTGTPEDRAFRVRATFQLVGAMQRAGVKILAGTDSPPQPFLYPGFSLHEELRDLVDAGLTPLEALRTATANPAEFLGETGRGTIARGKAADVVLLGANPIEAIGNTEAIEAVVMNGRYFSRTDLDALLHDIHR